MSFHHNPKYIHHQKNINTSLIREAVFGMEDGMVSTFGAVTGLATSTQNPVIVILSGSIIIAVESISMAVGSYLSSKSEQAINERKIEEERQELKEYPAEEKEELIGMYKKDGWPAELSREMAEVASKNKKLFLQEMAYRELKVFPEKPEAPFKNGGVMLVSYMVGGLIPLVPYFIVPISMAMPISIGVTLLGLFSLGASTTRFSRRPWWKVGLEMLILGAVAASVGHFVGQGVERWTSK